MNRLGGPPVRNQARPQTRVLPDRQDPVQHIPQAGSKPLRAEHDRSTQIQARVALRLRKRAQRAVGYQGVFVCGP